MRKGLGSLLLLCSLLVAAPVCAGDDWILYDNFASGFIKPNKWYGYDSGLTGRETQRMVVSERLQLSERCYNSTESDVGSSYSEQILRMMNTSNIRGIKALVKPVHFETIGCSTSPYSSWVYARLFGRFFNTNPQGSDSSINEVYAYIAIERTSLYEDADNIAKIIARVRQCSDDNCTTYKTLFMKELGTVKKGQAVTLSLEWDQAAHQFVFKRGDKKAVFAYNPKEYPDKLPPNYNNKMLSVLSGVPYCTSLPRPTAFVSALFDDVYIKTASP